MAITFTQTDTAAQDGTNTACSSGTSLAGGSSVSSQMSEGATAGSTEQTVKNSAGVNSVVGFNVQSAPGEPGASTWDSGDWTIRLDVTTGNTNVTWQEIHICEFDSSGNSLGSVASATGLGITCSAGVKSTTVTQSSDYTPNSSTSEVYLVYVFDFGGNHGNEQIGVTPSQDIASPITTSAAQTFTETIHTNASGFAAADDTASFKRGFDVYALGSARASETVSFKRSSGVDAVSDANLDTAASFLCTLNANAVGDVALTTGLKFTEQLDVSATGNVNLTALRTLGEILNAKAIGDATVSEVALFTRQFNATASGRVALSVVNSFVRVFVGTALGRAVLTAFIPKSLRVAAIVDPHLKKAIGRVEKPSVEATGSAGMSFSKTAADEAGSFTEGYGATAVANAELETTFYDENGLTWDDKRMFARMAGRSWVNSPAGKKRRKEVEVGSQKAR